MWKFISAIIIGLVTSLIVWNTSASLASQGEVDEISLRQDYFETRLDDVKTDTQWIRNYLMERKGCQ